MRKLCLAAGFVAALTADPSLAADPRIEPARLAAHVKVLASDDFEGREPGTPGEERSVAYIVKAFRNAGLKPGGDPRLSGGRAWTQDVPLARFQTLGPVAVGVTAGGQTQVWTQGEQIALRAAQTGATRISIKDAPVVFVGYGVTAPERRWDDFKGVDLKGKVALVLVNDPDFESGQGDFGGKAMTYYGRWTYKFEEAARRGALGFLVVHETSPAAYGWATVKNSNTNAIFDIIRDDPAKAHAPIEGWVQRDAAAALFKAAGLDFDAEKAKAQSRNFQPVALNGVTFSTDFDVEARKVVSRNVVGLSRGARAPGETVILTAHWDHLGVGLPDARGDRIYNGAVDNAGGVAALIELARAFATARPTARSVVFLAVTAEEKLLLGSEYYAAHPLYPLATTVANLNMDALRPTGPARDVSTAGDGGLTLQDDLIAVAKAHGRGFTPDPNPQAGSFFRSDHFSLAKRGVPAISIGSGQDLVTGGRAAGAAWLADYTANRYHQPADEWNDSWDLAGVAADVELVYDLARKLATSRGWPTWNVGSPFKTVRDETAAARK